MNSQKVIARIRFAAKEHSAADTATDDSGWETNPRGTENETVAEECWAGKTLWVAPGLEDKLASGQQAGLKTTRNSCSQDKLLKPERHNFSLV
jgi:hypothetical protein